LPEKRLSLDIGAGTGITAIALEKAGYSVTAIEYDESMIEKIHKKTKQISIVNGDMREKNIAVSP
jgi:16S rRNA A1518/A1519 N6-dimethyltransferase RsmA/KsgA/DIM1 with predicted DNA glycosylase/AP lyase activity